MGLNLYTVKYWSAVEWGYIEYDALAGSEDQVRAKVDKDCASEHRLRPYVSDDRRTDTLEIECHGPVELPYVLSSSRC
jgi:hypothetical protein